MNFLGRGGYILTKNLVKHGFPLNLDLQIAESTKSTLNLSVDHSWFSWMENSCCFIVMKNDFLV